MKCNKASLIEFHAYLTRFLSENNIKTEQENDNESLVAVEKVLASMVQVQNQLKVPNNYQEINKTIDRMTMEISQSTVLTIQ